MKYFLGLLFITLSFSKVFSQGKNLADCIILKNGVLQIFAFSESSEDSFFQLSKKRSSKTVFWEVFREVGDLKRAYEVNKLPLGIYKFQFALDGNAVYGEVSKLTSGTSMKIFNSDISYKRPFFDVAVDGDTLQVVGFFGENKEVRLSMKNEAEDDDTYSSNVKLSDGGLKTQYILSEFNPGIYVIRAQIEDRTFVRNFEIK
ncbi:hypothetical protein [Flammeovirga pacifica]|uniref:Uncharacterized protein n=1 Tax=Flammeovirga pacifica TaxID=915059 RepID=A0A1S1Z3F5_FLAPC|nr:hypothetical protein [Flammeovirga pacifica]OHX67762.1 hypothetical protein NH26_16135 [Flammeovirga pacifica]